MVVALFWAAAKKTVDVINVDVDTVHKSEKGIFSVHEISLQLPTFCLFTFKI